jgi:hypothetical protein
MFTVMLADQPTTAALCATQALSNEATTVERTTQRLFQEVRALEADLLHTLSEATSAEKSSSKTAADIRALRSAAEAEDMLIAQVRARKMLTQAHTPNLCSLFVVELRWGCCLEIMPLQGSFWAGQQLSAWQFHVLTQCHTAWSGLAAALRSRTSWRGWRWTRSTRWATTSA